MHRTVPASSVPFLLCSLLLLLPGCDSSEPERVYAGEPERISAVTMRLTLGAGAAPQSITIPISQDSTAEAPYTIVLRRDLVYTGEILLDSEAVSASEIRSEIRSEAEYHRFAFSTSPESGVDVNATDRESDYVEEDVNGGDYEVGLLFELDPEDETAQPGVLDIVLYHFGDSDKMGGDDVGPQVDFSVSIPYRFF